MLHKPTERPIAFSDAMAAAVRAGLQTQTRRKIKLPPYYPDEDLMVFARTYIDQCPYGVVGDILWVRETWRPQSWTADFDCMVVEYRDGYTQRIDPFDVWDDSDAEGLWDQLCLDCKAAGCYEDPDTGSLTLKTPEGLDPIEWQALGEMPYGLARTFTELTAVKPEYLQDITEADAIAEGVVRVDGYSAIDSFIALWDSIIKNDPFDSNPCVWVLDFKILQPFKILQTKP